MLGLDDHCAPLVAGKLKLEAVWGPAVSTRAAGAHTIGVTTANGSLRLPQATFGLRIRFDEGFAETLPYPDGSFDVLVSIFGIMFSPLPATLRR